MTLLAQRLFRGEVPRLPDYMLPEGAGQLAINCDLQHGNISGVRGNAVVASNLLVAGRAVRSVWTEDGSNMFAWSYDADIVKSQIVEEKWHRIYYTIVYGDTPLIKVARTHRVDKDGKITQQVIGDPVVGGNWQPPENSSPGAGFSNSGPDAWLLGVPDPDCAGDGTKGAGFAPDLVLHDKPAWPGDIKMALRVIFFMESPTGEIVTQVDISNNETPGAYPQVYYTVSGNNDDRGNKIQDMLWPLGGYSRPFKYYWYLPPDFTNTPIGRQVIVTNEGAANMVITYGSGELVEGAVLNPIIDQA